MIARTHDLAAVTALGIVAVTVPLPRIGLDTALIALLTNQIGGILPDIDEPTAPLWRNLPIGGFVGRGVDKLLGGHRFLTHSLVGLALIGFLADKLLHLLQPLLHSANLTVVWWALMIGLLSHLVMDSFTKEGVPWLLPIPFKFGFPPLQALRITTGHAVEKLVIFPGLLALDVYLAWLWYPQLHALVHRL